MQVFTPSQLQELKKQQELEKSKVIEEPELDLNLDWNDKIKQRLDRWVRLILSRSKNNMKT